MKRRNGFGSPQGGTRLVEKLKDKYKNNYFCYFIEDLIEKNIPNKLEDLKKPITAAATRRIETGQLPEVCHAIERLLVHEIDSCSPVCERCTVKRDFENKEKSVFCITEYKTPFPEEIKKMEYDIVKLIERKYGLRIRFGPLTKKWVFYFIPVLL